MYTAIEKLKFRESFMKLHFPMDIFKAFCECASKSNGALFLLTLPVYILISRYDRSRNLSYIFSIY